MGFFGEADGNYQNVAPDNPLGIKQAPDGAANQGEPVNDGAAGRDVGEMEKEAVFGKAQPEGQSQPQQKQSMEVPIEDVDVNDDFEKKVAFIKQKVKSPEEFEKSISELEQKLGINPDEANITNQEEAVNYYIQLEKRLGDTSNTDDTRQALSRLQQENMRLRQLMQQQQMQSQVQQMQQPQQPQQPVRDPQTGRFINPNQQQPQKEEGLTLEDVMADLEFDISSDDFINEIYEKGANSEAFKKVVAETSLKTAERLVEQKLAEQQEEMKQQQMAEQQRRQHAKQLNNNYRQQMHVLNQKYGENNVEQHKQDILNFFQQYPMYLDPTMFPNGFEIAFNEVRDMSSQMQNQQQNMQRHQQYNNAQKKAARIPQSQSNNKRNFGNSSLSQEEIEKRQIFSSGGMGGLWG